MADLAEAKIELRFIMCADCLYIEQMGYQIKGKKYPGLWESIRSLFQRS